MKTEKQSRIYNDIARKLYPNQTTSAAGERMAFVKGYERAESDLLETHVSRQRVIAAFDEMWLGDGVEEFEPDYEYHRRNFITKLNEV